MNEDFAKQIQAGVEAGKQCFGTPEPKLGMLPTKAGKPFNWNVSDCIDFKLKLEFTKSFNSALEEIRRDKTELAKWRLVATQVAAKGGDVSTPERFLANQRGLLTELLDTRDKQSDRIGQLEKLLSEVDISTEAAWHSWLYRRDQALATAAPVQQVKADDTLSERLQEPGTQKSGVQLPHHDGRGQGGSSVATGAVQKKT
jgi:hypothetical protein